jgi:hypothetical protein
VGGADGPYNALHFCFYPHDEAGCPSMCLFSADNDIRLKLNMHGYIMNARYNRQEDILIKTQCIDVKTTLQHRQ